MKVGRVDRTASTLPWGRLAEPSIDVVWASLPVMLPVLVTLMSAMVAIDLAYQVRAGDLIIGMRSIPRVDSFTFTMAGRPWLDQQWGAQLLMALVHRAGGWGGLTFLHAALIGGSFAMIYRACRVRGAAPAAASLLAMTGFVLGLPALAMRPQLFAAPLFAATLLLLVRRDVRPRRMWWIPAIAVAWANLHGSFVMVPALMALAALQDLGRGDRPGARRVALVGICAVGATLLNPFGFHVWTYVVALSTDPIIRTSVSEWAPVTVSSFQGAAFFATAAAGAGWLVLRRERTPWPDLVWLGAFFLLTLPASRGVIWWGLAAPVVMAGLLPADVPTEPDEHPRVRSAHSGSPLLNLAVLGALTVAVVVALVQVRAGSPATLLREAPQGLVAAAAAEVPSGSRLVVPEPWASWFEYALASDPVFVDARFELFPNAVWADDAKLRLAQDGWREVLDRWHVDAVVVDSRDGELAPLLNGDAGWRLAYRDGDGLLYVRS